MSYLITNILWRFPKKWEKMELIISEQEKFEIEVLEFKNNTIWKINITLQKAY
jgi:hypothetical protein